jgi:hypothetical protein
VAADASIESDIERLAASETALFFIFALVEADADAESLTDAEVLAAISES